MTLKALILDVDGTLAETADVKRAAFNQTFAELGLDWVWGRAVYARIMANTRAGNEAEYFALMRHPDDFNRLERDGLLALIPQRQQLIYLDLLEAGATPLSPGIARLMGEAVLARLKLALCSTGPRAEFETLLFTRFGPEMIDALSCSVAAEDLRGMSTVQAYRACIHKLGEEPSDIVAIDDSSHGVAGAAGLGLRVIATPSHYNWRSKFPGARLVLSNLGQPTAPFQLRSGTFNGKGFLSLEALRQWHQGCYTHLDTVAA